MQVYVRQTQENESPDRRDRFPSGPEKPIGPLPGRRGYRCSRFIHKAALFFSGGAPQAFKLTGNRLFVSGSIFVFLVCIEIFVHMQWSLSPLLSFSYHYPGVRKSVRVPIAVELVTLRRSSRTGKAVSAVIAPSPIILNF